MKKKLGEELWREKEKIALGYLEEVLTGKPGELTSDAWLGVGVKQPRMSYLLNLMPS